MNNFRQFNNVVVNFESKILDLVLVHSTLYNVAVDVIGDVLYNVDRLHPPLDVIITAVKQKPLNVNIIARFNFGRANYEVHFKESVAECRLRVS